MLGIKRKEDCLKVEYGIKISEGLKWKETVKSEWFRFAFNNRMKSNKKSTYIPTILRWPYSTFRCNFGLKRHEDRTNYSSRRLNWSDQTRIICGPGKRLILRRGIIFFLSHWPQSCQLKNISTSDRLPHMRSLLSDIHICMWEDFI